MQIAMNSILPCVFAAIRPYKNDKHKADDSYQGHSMTSHDMMSQLQHVLFFHDLLYLQIFLQVDLVMT